MLTTKPTPVEFRKLWSDTLRSGKYTQGKHLLFDLTANTCCCLGVACELYQEIFGDLKVEDKEAGPVVHSEVKGHNCRNYNGTASILPNEVAKALDIGTRGLLKRTCEFGHPQGLTEMNDRHGKTFDQIADIIDSDDLESYENTRQSWPY